MFARTVDEVLIGQFRHFPVRKTLNKMKYVFESKFDVPFEYGFIWYKNTYIDHMARMVLTNF